MFVNESQDQLHLRQDKIIIYVPPRDLDTCLTYSDEVADSGIFRYFLRRETKFWRTYLWTFLKAHFGQTTYRNWFIAVLKVLRSGFKTYTMLILQLTGHVFTLRIMVRTILCKQVHVCGKI